MSKKKKLDDDVVCFWCSIQGKKLSPQDRTRDHLIPLGMGGNDNKTVFACRTCNEERGKVTELYSSRIQLIKNIEARPERITHYKNSFRKQVKKLSSIILKWEFLHREKNIFLPFSLLEIVRLDELMPSLFNE